MNKKKLEQYGEIFGKGFARGANKNPAATLEMRERNMLSWGRLHLPATHLDNTTYTANGDMPCFLQEGENNMAYKINRPVTIAGQKKWIHANTEQEYIEKVFQYYTDSNSAPAPSEKRPFNEYAQKWFDTYAKPSIATVTANTYQRQINKYLIPAFTGKSIQEITTDDVQALFNSMGNCAKETKQKVKVVLNMILTSASEDGLIVKNPMQSKRLRINGKQSTTTETYSVEQMQYLVSKIGNVAGEQDRMYIALQALHPMRLEEVLGLKWRDIDLENNLIYIRQVVTHPDRNQPEVKEPKTATSVRSITLSTEAKKYLSVSGHPDSFVIGGEKPLSYTQVRRMCNRIKKDTGFGESITPIRFRTTVLTDMYDQTKDIKLTQAAAGHATADMTLKHYVKGRTNAATNENTVTLLYTANQTEIAKDLHT